MLAAALGRERDADLSDLTQLGFGVRIDQPGEFLQDFHTAHSFDSKQAFISYRHYLCDAVFIVGLESDDKVLLSRIEEALRHPRFPLYLGRRACPPAGQLVLSLEELPLEEALRQVPWQAAKWYQRKLRREKKPELDLIIDAPFGTQGSFTRRDLPLSFDPEHRRYGFRSLCASINAIPVKNPQWRDSDSSSAVGRETEQDPLSALEVD
jgi:CRISPR system Cascade subunit CasD